MTIETRAYETDLEIRSTGDGRTICGICVPYNVEQRINTTLTEVFRAGAFSRVIPNAHRVKLLVGHDAQALPIGRATLLREDTNGLYGEFKSLDETLKALSTIKGFNHKSLEFIPLSLM